MTRRRVRWSESAASDLEDLLNWIESDSGIDRAASVYRRLRKAASRLETTPQRGRRVPELLDLGVREYRELVVAPWRILYRVSKRDVFVEAVLDARRDLAELLLARFARQR